MTSQFFSFRISLLSLMFLPVLKAQGQVAVKGAVMDFSGVVAGGEAILTDTAGMFVCGDQLEESKFRLKTGQPGIYYLAVRVPGYRPLDTLIQLQNGDNDLGNLLIVAAAETLNEVAIIAQRPVFERTGEGTRVNVENTLLSRTVNAAELLSRLPGITIVGGKVNLLAKGEAMIVINGKESTLERFKSLPPSSIQHIEVISNPGARFDSKAKAVIQVTMKKSYSQGLSLTLTDNVTENYIPGRTFGKHWQNASNVALDFRKNKWNFSSSLSNEAGLNWSENVFTTKTGSDSASYVAEGRYVEDNYSRKVWYYRSGIGYELNDKSSVSLQYDGFSHYFELDVDQQTAYKNPSGLVTDIRMHNDATTRLLNHSVNLNYQLQTDTLGSNLLVGMQYNQFTNRLLDHITESISESGAEARVFQRINDSWNAISLYTAQGDYTKKLKRGSLDAGAKWSYATNDGRIDFLSKHEHASEYTANPLLANATHYQEMIPAIYTSWKLVKGKWNTTIGLRVEHSMLNSFSKKSGVSILDTSYTNLFPSIRGGVKLNGSWSTSLSWARKINRPVYQDLDPFLWYLDSLTSIRGNSRLKPELVDQFELRLSRNQITFRLGCNSSRNTIWAVAQPGTTGPNSITFIKDNLQGRLTLLAAIDIPVEVKKYASFTSISCNYSRFSDARAYYKTAASTPMLYIYSWHKLELPKGFSTELLMDFYGASSDGFADKKAYYYFTWSISRNFLKDKLNLQLMVNDFAGTARFKGTRTINTFSTDYNQRYNTRYVRLTLTWSFSTLERFNYRNKQLNESEYNRIKK